MTDSETKTLTTLARGFAILEWIQEHEGGQAREIARNIDLDLSPSTVHRYLQSLEEEGYLVREDGVYRLSLKFLALGEQARSRQELASAEEYVDMLAKESGCRSTFVVEEGGQGIYHYTAPGEHGVWTKSTIGKRIPLHATAAGKAILSALPETRVQEIVEEVGLTAETERTITDVGALYDEIEDVRERGYAFNEEEQIEGVRAVGAPIVFGEETVIGAFSVSGPANRLTGDRFREELPNTVLGITNEFELKLELS